MKITNILSVALSLLAVAGVVAVYTVPAQGQPDPVAVAITEFSREETRCLALNIYYEARSSNLADKAAVADVVLNRTLDRRYPGTICGVVQDGSKPGKKNCQFSWHCDGKSDIPKNQDRWNEAQTIANNMLTKGKFRGITEGATHYHATYVNPYWSDSLQMVGQIGEHVYYRWE